MLMPLLDAATNEGLPVFLFGASPETLAKAERKLDDHSDGLLKIAGTLAPSATFDPEGAEADAAIAKIAASGARLCIVALGAPKQEIFAQRAREKGLACGMLCVGAAIDFVAGAQVRAPGLLRRSGLEWLWRLATNPRRFAWRYAQCAMLLGDILLTPMRAPPARERV
jgi:exopolysaccharide biosynthesis WecB/TagA/CpsF family protein